MWNPTHVQFTVLRARNLIAKGKSGNNDVFVTIQVGKQKFQTSTIKHAHNPEWFEECDLEIPSLQEDIEVTVYHRSILQDDFLGFCSIPLSDYKVYDRPKSQWVSLGARPKKPDNKYRGEIEMRLTFHVKSMANGGDSFTRKKRPASFRSVASAVGDKLKFIRSSSFRDKPMMSSNGGRTDSLLQRNIHRTLSEPSTKIGAEAQGFITNGHEGTNNNSNMNMLERSPRQREFPAYDETREANSAGEMRLRRTMSTPVYKVSAGRPRIQMGSANIKSEAIDAKLRSMTLTGIREETGEKDHSHEKSPSVNILSTSVPVRPNYLDDSSSPVKMQQPTYAAIVKKTPNEKVNRNSKTSSAEDVSAGFEDYLRNRTRHSESTRGKNSHAHSGSDSDEAGSSSRSGNHKDGSDGSGPTVVRRRSKDKKMQLMRNADVMGRRYTVQGMDFRPRPSMYMYDDMFGGTSCQGEFRRSYTSPHASQTTDLVTMYRSMTKEELTKLVTTYKAQLIRKDQYIKDLEEYIDDLLVRVMENTPRILSKADQRYSHH
uniref:Rab11-interacting protein n=1 Tax=Leptochiton asellus TaxID=211853 RepID=A0A0Y0I051_9MOLL|nr:rab11-interacting protein [Leptochiton asellus]